MSTLFAPPRGRLVQVSQGDPDPEFDERALVERARVDIDAFAELYRHYLPRIHSFALRRTGSVEAAEDVCSATFEAALRNIARFKWQPGGVAPWLFRIAGNQTIAHYRREARTETDRGQRAMAQLHVDATAEPTQPLGDDAHELRAALDALSPRYQRAIALRYLADLDHGAAAQAMGLAKPAFAVVLSRALRAMRRELASKEADR